MKTIFSLSLFVLFFCVGTSNAQVKLQKGKLSALKGVKQMTVKFTYDNMAVGKFKKEEDYLNKKVADYNKKEAGRGDKWRESWVNDRKTRFEPKFIELFEKSAPVDLVEEGNTKYTMIVNTDFTEPGFNVAVMRKFAEVRTTVKIVDSQSNEVIAVLYAAGPGRTYGGYDFDTGLRISEAYAKTGKDLGKYLYKKGIK